MGELSDCITGHLCKAGERRWGQRALCCRATPRKDVPAHREVLEPASSIRGVLGVIELSLEWYPTVLSPWLGAVWGTCGLSTSGGGAPGGQQLGIWAASFHICHAYALGSDSCGHEVSTGAKGAQRHLIQTFRMRAKLSAVLPWWLRL